MGCCVLGPQQEEESVEPICSRTGCGRQTWNGQAGYCSHLCKSKSFHDSGSRPLTVLKELFSGDEKFEEIKKQYEEKWDKNRCAPTPIQSIYAVLPSSTLELRFTEECHKVGDCPKFGHGKNPGNVQRRFHGTRLKCSLKGGFCCQDKECSTCGIIQNGFDIKKVGSWSGNDGLYGKGIYFTSASSTAKGYGMKAGFTFENKNWMSPDAGNAVLVCKVCCGRCQSVDDRDTSNLDRSRYESRKVDKPSGADELVVWEAEKTIVSYVIVF